MPHVMAESSRTNYSPPIGPLVLTSTRNEVANTVVTDVLGICDDVINATSQVHHTEGVLESAVRSGGVDKVRQSKLVDVP